MVSILDNKTIAELVVKNGDDYQKINPETLATIVEDVTGTTTETEKTVQEHIDNKSIHLTAEDVEDLTKDNLKSEDIVAGANITVTTDPDTNKVTISTTDHPVEDFLTKEDIKAEDSSISVIPSETDNTVSLKVNFPDSSKYLVQQNIKPGNQNITVEYSPDSNNVLISASNNSYTAGDGIAISRDNIVTNTKPDQIISLNPGKNIAITGDYPNFTIIGTNDAQRIVESFTATEGQTTFVASHEIYDKSVLSVNVGNTELTSAAYTLGTDKKTVTLVSGLTAGTLVDLKYFYNLNIGTEGITFTPELTPMENGYTLSWTNDGGLENPTPVDITSGKGINPKGVWDSSKAYIASDFVTYEDSTAQYGYLGLQDNIPAGTELTNTTYWMEMYKILKTYIAATIVDWGE